MHIKKTIIDQAVVSGGNFLTILLGARFLTLEDQGKLGYILSAYLAVSILYQVSIFQIASVEAPKADEFYLGFIQILQTAISIGGTILGSSLLIWLGTSSGWNISIFELIIIAFFLFLQQHADFVRRNAYIFSTPTVSLISSSIMYSTRLLLLLFLKPNNILSFLLILVFTALLPAIKSMIDLFIVKKDYNQIRKHLQPHFSMAKWLILSGPLTWLWSNIPILFLGTKGNLTLVGVFTTIRSITNIGNILLEILETNISATVGKLYFTNKPEYRRLIKNILYIGFVLWFIGFIVISVVGKEFLAFINKSYTDYSNLFNILWFGILAIFLYRLTTVTTRTMGRTNIIFVSLVIGSIISLIVSYILIPRFQLFGAAVAIGFAPLSMWLLQLVDAKLYDRNEKLIH